MQYYISIFNGSRHLAPQADQTQNCLGGGSFLQSQMKFFLFSENYYPQWATINHKKKENEHPNIILFAWCLFFSNSGSLLEALGRNMRLCRPNLQTAKVPLSESCHSHKRLSVLICQDRWKDLRSSSWELYPEGSEFKLRGDGGDTSVSQSALRQDGGDPNRMLSSPQGHFSPLKFPQTYNSKWY